MANYYTTTSAKLEVPPKLIDRAMETAERVYTAIEYEEGSCNIEFDNEDDGIWFFGEYVTPDHMVDIAKEIIEELELTTPFICSWAHTCERPIIDAFGGGAALVRLGRDTIYIDALSELESKRKTIDDGRDPL